MLQWTNKFTRPLVSQIDKDPEQNPGASPVTLLDWVGRNHGRKKYDSERFDARRTNFLYLDGHVVTRHVKETVSTWKWGEKFYTLERN